MKIVVSLVMIVALSLSVNGQPLKSEGLASELLEFCESEIEECLKFYHSLKDVGKVVMAAEKYLTTSHKRQLLGDDTLEKIKNFFKNITGIFSTILEKAKDTFAKITSGQLNFTETVKKLIGYIHSDPTVSACKAALKKYATPILGDFATDEQSIAHTLCNSALLKIEETIG